MATHSSTIAWRIPWTEQPGRLQSMGSQKVRHDCPTFTFTFHFLMSMSEVSLSLLCFKRNSATQKAPSCQTSSLTLDGNPLLRRSQMLA